MDSVVAVLDRARSAGLKLWVEGDALQVEGHPTADAQAVIEALRQLKPEIMAVLEAEASLPGGALGLLDRLRKGARFLMDAQQTLLETGERHTRLEQRFLAGIDLFDSLDYTLRFTYPDYQGCVLGPGQRCPDDAPVRCRACAGMVVTETGEQRYA